MSQSPRPPSTITNHVAAWVSIVSMIMAVAALWLPMIQSGQLSGKLPSYYSSLPLTKYGVVDIDLGLWGFCEKSREYAQYHNSWHCYSYPSSLKQITTINENFQANAADILTMQSLYTCGVCFVTLAVCACAVTYYNPKGGYAAAACNFLAGTFFLSTGAYMATSMETNAALGWGYSFAFTWIGWLLCWLSIGPSLMYSSMYYNYTCTSNGNNKETQGQQQNVNVQANPLQQERQGDVETETPQTEVEISVVSNDAVVQT